MRRCNQNLAGLIGRVMVIILVVSAWFACPSHALAANEQPTSVSLDEIIIFNGLLVTGDALAFVPYEISFITAPDPNITATYLFRLMSADGATEIGTVTAQPDYDGGYGPGAVSFYIEGGLTEGTAYIFRVQQNPSYYDDPQYWDFTVDISNYSQEADQAEALKDAIVASAVYLTTVFEDELLAKSEAGITVLSTYGELYYLDVIPGLQVMSPNLFSVQLENPDFTKRTWSTTVATTIQTKYSGTIFYDFMTGFAGLFSLETYPAMNFLSTILFIIVVAFSVGKLKGNLLSSMLDGYAFLLLLMLIGWFSMIWAGFIAFASGAIGGVILFLKRA